MHNIVRTKQKIFKQISKTGITITYSSLSLVCFSKQKLSSVHQSLYLGWTLNTLCSLSNPCCLSLSLWLTSVIRSLRLLSNVSIAFFFLSLFPKRVVAIAARAVMSACWLARQTRQRVVPLPAAVETRNRRVNDRRDRRVNWRDRDRDKKVPQYLLFFARSFPSLLFLQSLTFRIFSVLACFFFRCSQLSIFFLLLSSFILKLDDVKLRKKLKQQETETETRKYHSTFFSWCCGTGESVRGLNWALTRRFLYIGLS